MKGLLLTVIFLLFVNQPIDAQTSKITKRVGSIALGWNYKPKSVTSLINLSTEIEKKVTRHLTDRLGEEFYNKLKFSYGIIVDYNELCRLDGCNYQWKVFSYKLVYAFSYPEIGIKLYEAEIWLDEKGDVIKEIDLPAIKQNPEKANFISVKEAISIGKRNKFRTSYVELAYRNKDDSIVWRLIKRPTESDRATWRLDISAHNGIVLDKIGYEGIQ